MSGWVDLGDLDTVCQIGNCSEDFSVSMWMKYYPKENDEDQSFLRFGEFKVALKTHYSTSALAINTSTLYRLMAKHWYQSNFLSFVQML